MNGRGTTKTIERELREIAQGDMPADLFRAALRRQLLQQAEKMAPRPERRVERSAREAIRPVRPGAGLRVRGGRVWNGLSPRWSVALTAAILLVVLASTGYATEPIINQLFGRSPDTGQPLGIALDLSQTAGGYTMTLHRAYADRQYIILGYTVTSADGHPVNGVQPVADAGVVNDPTLAALPRLTDEHGQAMPALGGSGYSSVQSNAQLTTYSAATIPGNVSRITLHLEANAMEVPRNHTIAVVQGKWAFTFTVPVAPSRIAEPRQTVVDRNGWAVTLERVAITPTMVGAMLRGAGTEAHVELIAGDKHYILPAPGGYEGDAETGRAMKACFAESRQCSDLWKGVAATYGASADVQDGRAGGATGWMESLQNQRGQWTLIVTAAKQPGKLAQPQGGPWIFHFAMP